MRWNERQLAMLREMGLRVWAPASVVATSGEPAVAEAIAPDPEPGRTDGMSVALGHGVVKAAVAELEPAATLGRAAASASAASFPVPAGVATLDDGALRAAAAGCTACALCAGRTRSVFGGTPARADWMVVGEPPVEAEDRAGEPFVGKPGQLLDNMLRAVGVVRHGELSVPSGRACATVPVKCRPPGNRPPTADEFATCEAYLARQIELAEAKIVLALGSAAALLLRTTEPLGRLRGRVHRYRGLPLVATYAPAYLLRHPLDKARAWDDLCLAVEAIGAASP